MKARLVHCKKEPYDVYIGRPSEWGNPFEIGPDGDREAVIEKYKSWIINQPHLLDKLRTLEGKTLGCWCHPKPCHGDVLIELLDNIVYQCQSCMGVYQYLVSTCDCYGDSAEDRKSQSQKFKVGYIVYSNDIITQPQSYRIDEDGYKSE